MINLGVSTKGKSEKYFLEIVEMAMNMFNRQIGTDFSLENVEVQLVSRKNADEVLPVFLENYKDAVEPAMFIPGYIETIRAEAFVTSDRQGILARTDLDDVNGYQWKHLILHELSHIFCTKNELESKERFYKKYCENFTDNEIEDGYINAVYTIWKEFIAEFMAIIVDEDMADNHLNMFSRHSNYMVDEIKAMVNDDKLCMSAILIDIISSVEIPNSEDFEEVIEALKHCGYSKVLESRNLLEIVRNVYEKIFTEPFWQIDLDFIENLGSLYVGYKTMLLMKSAGFLGIEV